MTDLLSRANVDIAINTLLDDLQPNDAIQPSDHNGLLKDILDTLSNGLSTTLRTNPETSGQDIQITSGDNIKFKNSGFVSSLLTDTLTATRTLTFPDNSGTIALLSDITGGNSIYSANDSLTGNREVNLNAFNLDFINGANSLFKITTSGNISKGSDNAEVTSGFKHTDINDDIIFDIRNNGQIGYGGEKHYLYAHKFRNPNNEARIVSFDDDMLGTESFVIQTNGRFYSEQFGQTVFISYRQAGQSYAKIYDAGVESIRLGKAGSFINGALRVGGVSGSTTGTLGARFEIQQQSTNTFQQLFFANARMTTTGRTNSSSSFGTAQAGLECYDTTLNKKFIWNGSAWEQITSV